MNLTLTGAIELSVMEDGVRVTVRVEDARRCTENGEVRITEDGEVRSVE